MRARGAAGSAGGEGVHVVIYGGAGLDERVAVVVRERDEERHLRASHIPFMATSWRAIPYMATASQHHIAS